MYADTIVTTNNLFTGREGAARPGALAIGGGRVLSAGSESDALAFAQCSTRMLDVGDAFVCPGLHDAHAHVFHSALYASPLALRHAGTSEADCVAALEPLAARRPAGSWLLCQGWREYRWDPPCPPTRASLDAAWPDRPVAMYSGDAHTLWLNTCALRRLGVAEDAPDPAGGTYERDGQGRLTGLVREAAAMALMPRIVAEFSEEELLDAYRGFVQRCNSHGITSVCDVSLMAQPGLDFVRDDLYAALDARGQLSLRAHLFPTLLPDRSRFHALHERFGGCTSADGARPAGARIVCAGFKQFFDGVSSQHTAWLAEPYSNARTPGECGRPTVPPAQMRAMVLAAHGEGWPVRIHAIGDAAIHACLDIFEEATWTFGPLPAGRHHTIEHLEGFLPGDVRRLGRLGVVASMQPVHLPLDPYGPAEDLGPERVQWMWPFRTLQETGATLAFGTDSPVCDVDPRPGLYIAATRAPLPGATFEALPGLADERIGAADALRAYTAGSAMAAQRAHELGTLAPGMLADFAIWDTNLAGCAPEQLLDARVKATYVGGTCVWEA